MRTQEQRHLRLGFPFLAGQDRPPLVGVKVVPPRPAKNTGLRGLHLDTSHAVGAKTGSCEEGKELRVMATNRVVIQAAGKTMSHTRTQG